MRNCEPQKTHDNEKRKSVYVDKLINEAVAIAPWSGDVTLVRYEAKCQGECAGCTQNGKRPSLECQKQK